MSSVIIANDRRFDDYTPRLRFNAPPPGYYIQPQYQVADAAGTDCRTFSDAASCDSSRSPGYQACTCRSAVDAEMSKTPDDTGAGGLQRHFEHNRHHDHLQQQQQQPASFAIHQLLGLDADIRHLDVWYDRQLALETIDSRHHPPPTSCRCNDCTQSFNADVDGSLSSPTGLGLRGSHQLDLSYCDRPTSATVAEYYRQHHGSTATKWPYLREPLQLPPPLTPWSNNEPHGVSKKTVHRHNLQQNQHQQQESRHHYDELQAYCAARLQPRNVDVTSYNSVIRQCRIDCLPPNLGVYTVTQ